MHPPSDDQAKDDVAGQQPRLLQLLFLTSSTPTPEAAQSHATASGGKVLARQTSHRTKLPFALRQRLVLRPLALCATTARPTSSPGDCSPARQSGTHLRIETTAGPCEHPGGRPTATTPELTNGCECGSFACGAKCWPSLPKTRPNSAKLGLWPSLVKLGRNRRKEGSFWPEWPIFARISVSE